VADLAQQLRPRYHFAVSERQYYEREPYQTDATDRHVTRFIGLAAFGNQEKMQASEWRAEVASQRAPIDDCIVGLRYEFGTD
jgi:hypothetical protein